MVYKLVPDAMGSFMFLEASFMDPAKRYSISWNLTPSFGNWNHDLLLLLSFLHLTHTCPPLIFPIVLALNAQNTTIHTLHIRYTQTGHFFQNIQIKSLFLNSMHPGAEHAKASNPNSSKSARIKNTKVSPSYSPNCPWRIPKNTSRH